VWIMPVPGGTRRAYIPCMARAVYDRVAAIAGVHPELKIVHDEDHTCPIATASRHTITVYMPVFAAAGADEMWLTMVHEFAHIIVGPEHQHDAVWTACVQKLGGVPETTRAAAMVVTSNGHVRSVDEFT
jgi:hypothetical protein